MWGGGTLPREARKPGITHSILNSSPTLEFYSQAIMYLSYVTLRKGAVRARFHESTLFKLEGPLKKNLVTRGEQMAKPPKS